MVVENSDHGEVLITLNSRQGVLNHIGGRVGLQSGHSGNGQGLNNFIQWIQPQKVHSDT